jgi:hypothetical protein
MQTTTKATLIVIGGVAVGALIGVLGFLLALPPDFDPIDGSPDQSSGSLPIATAGAAIGFATMLGSFCLAAWISGTARRRGDDA